MLQIRDYVTDHIEVIPTNVLQIGLRACVTGIPKRFCQCEESGGISIRGIVALRGSFYSVAYVVVVYGAVDAAVVGPVKVIDVPGHPCFDRRNPVR